MGDKKIQLQCLRIVLFVERIIATLLSCFFRNRIQCSACYQLYNSQRLIFSQSKVCSINFEPPDNDLCSACHVYPLSRGAWMISILFILNGFTWGVEIHNLMNISNSLTFNEVQAKRE